jgi:hypothetical protein
MPARELEAEQVAPEVAPEPVAPEAAEQEQQFTQEGELPAVAEAGAVAAGATASELAFGDQEQQQSAADTSHLDRGVHTWDHYRAACEAAGQPDKWQDHYRNGHTSAAGWTQPYESKSVNDFQLKKGHSASAALKAFLAGPTITDYRAALLAEEIDEVRDTLGDIKFDQLFGSANSTEDGAIPGGQRLRISSSLYTTPLPEQMKAIAAEHDEQLSKPEEEAPVAEVEARVEEKPESMEQAQEEEEEQELVRQELGLEQADRELA